MPGELRYTSARFCGKDHLLISGKQCRRPYNPFIHVYEYTRQSVNLFAEFCLPFFRRDLELTWNTHDSSVDTSQIIHFQSLCTSR